MRSLLPPLWGSPGLDLKFRHVVSGPVRYDRVFIGSSHLFRQIDPALLDSVLNDGGRSFNMALNASFSPETDLLLEELLRSEGPVPEVIVMELMPFMMLQEQNFAHYRYTYHIRPATAALLARHAWGLSGMHRTDRARNVMYALRAGVTASFLPGLTDRYFGAGSMVDTTFVMGPAHNGYVPADWQVAMGAGGKELRAQREDLLADTTQLARRRAGIMRAYRSETYASFSPLHAEMLKKLIRLGETRGSHVIFLLPPLWVDYGEDPVALYRALPAGHAIDLCDPQRFPEFYVLENAFDKGHLNSRGARIFTRRLAENLAELMAAER